MAGLVPVIFCSRDEVMAAAALFVFVLSLTYGLDLSPGFF